MYIEKRKVKKGKINLNGEKYYCAELDKYYIHEVELRSTGEGGYDIYWNDNYMCFLRTIPQEYLKIKD